MRILFFCLIVNFLHQNLLAQQKMKSITFLNNHVKMMVPKQLETMSEQTWNLKHHGAKRPLLVLCDSSGEVNLIAESTSQQAFNNTMESYVKERYERLKQRNTGLEFIDHGVKKIHGKDIGYIKFLSEMNSLQVYNMYLFLVADGKYVSCNFNCTQALRNLWESLADKTLTSIVINY